MEPTAHSPRTRGRHLIACVAALTMAAGIALPGGASAQRHGVLHYYHGTASNGQYLNLTTGPKSALVSFTRLWERCRPGGIHLLVNPAALLNFASLSKTGSFSRTVRLGGSSTSYKGTVSANSAIVKVDDAGNSLCEGTNVKFKLHLIR
jgi:hypothetical protein